jgi:hypothetical protein
VSRRVADPGMGQAAAVLTEAPGASSPSSARRGADQVVGDPLTGVAVGDAEVVHDSGRPPLGPRVATPAHHGEEALDVRPGVGLVHRVEVPTVRVERRRVRSTQERDRLAGQHELRGKGAEVADHRVRDRQSVQVVDVLSCRARGLGVDWRMRSSFGVPSARTWSAPARHHST